MRVNRLVKKPVISTSGFQTIRSIYVGILGLSVVLAVPARAADVSDPCIAISGCVEMGSDFLQTTIGTKFDFGLPVGTVEFVGSPIPGMGTTDTVVQRLADAIINGPPIPIKITQLSLVSKNPISLFGNLYNVSVALDPANLALDTGTATIFGTKTGPPSTPTFSATTFNSNLTVFFVTHFTPIGAAPPVPDVFANVTLSQTGGIWSPCAGKVPPVTLPCPAAPASSFIVSGADSPGPVSDLQFNMHTGMDSNEVDFFPIIISEQHFGSGTAHWVMPACILKPNTTDLVNAFTNPLFSGTPGSCPTGWICGGSPAPGVASYSPGAAQYPGGTVLFPTSSFSPTVLSGSGVIRQNTALKWVAGQTYYLNFYGGVPNTEPDGTTPVAGWPQTVRVYLTAGPGFAQVAAFDIPNPGKGNFVPNPLIFTLPSNSGFVGQTIGVLIFVNGSPNGFSANFDLFNSCDP
jgi:hypothetical protein